MEYDNLKVNGKRYTWSDAIHAVIDTQDNKVRQSKILNDDQTALHCSTLSQKCCSRQLWGFAFLVFMA